jgi:hypothetical protein
MIRLIVFALFVFLFYLIGKALIRLFFQPKNNNRETFHNRKQDNKQSNRINKDDIIDADFEEIDDKNK